MIDTQQTNTVAVSTMSCTYYLVNLKTNVVEAKIKGLSKYAVDLIRAPLIDKNPEEIKSGQLSPTSTQQKFCGIESNCIVQVDFEQEESRVLKQYDRAEFKSPWYSATFFLKDRQDFLVVGEELTGHTRCFQIQNKYYVDNK